MKKHFLRLMVIFTLIACLAVPTVSFAAGGSAVTLDLSTVTPSNSGTGWSCNASGDTLTLESGYTFTLTGTMVAAVGTVDLYGEITSAPVFGSIAVTVEPGGVISGGDGYSNVEFHSGTISGGTFNSDVDNMGGTINGGTFNGKVASEHSGTISGGTFNGTVTNDSTITNGTFNGTVTNEDNGKISGGTFASGQLVTSSGSITDGSFAGQVTLTGKISGGTFTDKVQLNSRAAEITKGTFSGAVNNASGTISGGTFNSAVTNSGTIKDGTFNRDVTSSGDILGGTFAKGQTVTSSGNIAGGSFAGQVALTGKISGGTFNSAVTNSGSITDGTFSGAVTNKAGGSVSGGSFSGGVDNSGTVTGGAFSGPVTNKAGGAISGGTFSAAKNNTDNYGVISGGKFACSVVNRAGGVISKGTFSGNVNNSGSIEGGTFLGEEAYNNKAKGGCVVYNENGGTIVSGVFRCFFWNESGGTVSGGTYWGIITNLGDPITSPKVKFGVVKETRDTSVVSGANTVANGSNYTAVFAADAGYWLDDSFLTIILNGDMASVHFTLDPATGKLIIKAAAKENLKGPMELTIAALPDYKVKFNANGGKGGMADEVFHYTEKKALTEGAFTREGYVFAGWNTAADGSGKAYADGQAVKSLDVHLTGTVTLYAQWTEASDASVQTGDMMDMTLYIWLAAASAAFIAMVLIKKKKS